MISWKKSLIRSRKLFLEDFPVGVIIFGSVRFFPIKTNQTEIFFFLKSNRNRTETESNRPVSVRFGSVFNIKKPRKPIIYFGLFVMGF
jgi:hypothetical protein